MTEGLHPQAFFAIIRQTMRRKSKNVYQLKASQGWCEPDIEALRNGPLSALTYTGVNGLSASFARTKVAPRP